jgi:hypothetical protein
MAYPTDGKIGIDLTAAASSSRAYTLETVVNASDGSVWQYVTNVTAITQYDCVAISANGTAAPVTTALANTGLKLGFAQVAFAASQNGWVALQGFGLKVNTDASCLPGVPLYTQDTAGSLSDATASLTHSPVLGVMLIATQSVAGATAANISYPLVRRPVA